MMVRRRSVPIRHSIAASTRYKGSVVDAARPHDVPAMRRATIEIDCVRAHPWGIRSITEQQPRLNGWSSAVARPGWGWMHWRTRGRALCIDSTADKLALMYRLRALLLYLKVVAAADWEAWREEAHYNAMAATKAAIVTWQRVAAQGDPVPPRPSPVGESRTVATDQSSRAQTGTGTGGCKSSSGMG